MKNICFVANYEKTSLFDAVAQKLTATNVFWIVVNKSLYNKLLESYPEDSILLIDKDTVLEKEDPSFDTSKYKLNEMWYGDRVLKHEKWGQHYLSNLAGIYYDFISTNNIDFVFGEQTWAHELLAHRVCDLNTALNCTSLSPHTVRMPSGKFSFFKDEFESAIKSFRPSDFSYPEFPLLQAKKPEYLALNDKLLDEKSKLSYFITKINYFFKERIHEAHDPTKPDSITRAFKGFFAYYINKKRYHWSVKEIKKKELENKKFVLFTLHKQPEASVDNTGRYYEDQLEVIKNIWRILPEDTLLIVKEHSNAIGDRKLNFYKSICQYKNVKFIEYNEDSYSLITMCEAVFTISGTVAYEAALMGKPSFTFIPIFFNQLSLCRHINFDTLRDPHNSLQTLIDSMEYDKDVDQKYTNWIHSNSFEGLISDYKSNPDCMNDENIVNLVKAFVMITSI
jgi:hypothetical protein